MASLTKCRSSKPYHEGNAVNVQPNSKDTTINVVAHGNQNKNWTPFDTIVDDRWKVRAYYYESGYAIDP